jgi:hypothetical protein
VGDVVCTCSQSRRHGSGGQRQPPSPGRPAGLEAQPRRHCCAPSARLPHKRLNGYTIHSQRCSSCTASIHIEAAQTCSREPDACDADTHAWCVEPAAQVWPGQCPAVRRCRRPCLSCASAGRPHSSLPAGSAAPYPDRSAQQPRSVRTCGWFAGSLVSRPWGD